MTKQEYDANEVVTPPLLVHINNNNPSTTVRPQQEIILSQPSSLSSSSTILHQINNSDGKPRDSGGGIFMTTLLRSPEEVWDALLKEGKEYMMKTTTTETSTSVASLSFAALEIGMNLPAQCIQAAYSNFETYCLEPSPVSFQKCQKIINRSLSNDTNVRDRIHLFDVAAGDTSGIMVEFSGGGGTGDMVGSGGIDMWNMKRNGEHQIDNKNKSSDSSGKSVKNKHIVQVQSQRLDDFITENISPKANIWIAKIDVQGFEPNVFQGLSQSIKEGRIRYILFEYWPKGMDLLQGVESLVDDGESICQASVQILKDLVAAGYTLYALNVSVHPHSVAHFSRNEKDLPQTEELMQQKYKHKTPGQLLNHFVVHDRPLDDF